MATSFLICQEIVTKSEQYYPAIPEAEITSNIPDGRFGRLSKPSLWYLLSIRSSISIWKTADGPPASTTRTLSGLLFSDLIFILVVVEVLDGAQRRQLCEALGGLTLEV